MATGKLPSCLCARSDGGVKVSEVQPLPCQVKPNFSHAKPGLCQVKQRPGRTESDLTEVDLGHRDIPLHRSRATTDLTQVDQDLSEAHQVVSEVKPRLNQAQSFSSRITPDPSKVKRKLIDVKPDLFFKSNRVLSLNRENFQHFVVSTDISMILFYQPDMPENPELMTKFAAAARTARRPGHEYAAVDCLRDPQLCLSQDVVRSPTITLYSFGNAIASLECPENIPEKHLRQFVEEAPNLQSSKVKFSGYTLQPSRGQI